MSWLSDDDGGLLLIGGGLLFVLILGAIVVLVRCREMDAFESCVSAGHKPAECRESIR